MPSRRGSTARHTPWPTNLGFSASGNMICRTFEYKPSAPMIRSYVFVVPSVKVTVAPFSSCSIDENVQPSLTLALVCFVLFAKICASAGRIIAPAFGILASAINGVGIWARCKPCGAYISSPSWALPFAKNSSKIPSC